MLICWSQKYGYFHYAAQKNFSVVTIENTYAAPDIVAVISKKVAVYIIPPDFCRRLENLKTRVTNKVYIPPWLVEQHEGQKLEVQEQQEFVHGHDNDHSHDHGQQQDGEAGYKILKAAKFFEN